MGLKTIRSFKKTVSTAGVRVALTSTSTPCASFTVKALRANTGYIYIGDSTVSSSTCDGLAANESLPAAADPDQTRGFDLSLVYIDASVSSEGVCVKYVPT